MEHAWSLSEMCRFKLLAAKNYDADAVSYFSRCHFLQELLFLPFIDISLILDYGRG